MAEEDADPPGSGLEITILQRADAESARTDYFESFLADVAAAAGVDRGEITVVLAADREVRQLNRTYRGRDRVTDVLTFPLEGGPRTARASGDMILATGKVARQAAQRHHAVATEFRYLLIHGFLHLRGMDHETDAGEMNEEEYRIRAAVMPDHPGRVLVRGHLGEECPE
ncbi:MAG: rRNA maturation RNase YbeY [Acidobacteriota bacterium]